MTLTNEFPRRLLHRIAPVLVIGLAALIFTPASVLAQPAHLSRGLTDRLADPSTTAVNFIVQGPSAEIDRIASTYGVRVVKRMDMGAVVTGSPAQVRAVAGDSNVGSLTGDDVVVSTMAVSTQSTGASQLWQGANGTNFGGLVGSGVGVVVIDSGIGLHPDVDRRVKLRVDFVNDNLGNPDVFGHGTHVASLIAGSGAGSRGSNGAAYIGMAPGAELVSLRVLDADGYGFVSDVVLALEWAIKNKDRYRLRVVNLSLGLATKEPYRTAPMALAVERAVAAGLVVVASAGNYGKLTDGTPIVGVIVSPGHTPGALTVGALNTRGTVERSDDVVASFSSRGPVGDPDAESTWELKPDLVAPGNAIVGAAAPDSYLWNLLADRHVIGASGGTYLTMSGASMSTAVVSGAVAQLLQAAPQLTPAQVKFVLQFTAQRLEGFGLIEQGAGSLNVPLAVALAEAGDLADAPSSVLIGGEMVDAGELAFLSAKTVVADGISVWANSKLWTGGRSPSGNGVVWGGNKPAGSGVVWGGKAAGSGVVWGGNKPAGSGVVWGGKAAGSGVVWGGKAAGSGVVWGGKAAGSGVVWGGKAAGSGVVWGGKAAGSGVVWGGNKPAGSGVVWGGKAAGSGVVWGGKAAGSGVVWGGKAAGSGVVWGGKAAGSGVVWGGNKPAGSGVVWGGKAAGSGVVWGGKAAGSGVVWGGKAAGSGVVWGGKAAGSGVVWGGKAAGSGVVWGGKAAGSGVVWGGKAAGSGVVWGGKTAGSGVVWGGKAAGSGVVWGGKAAGSGVVWGGKAAGSGVVWGGKAAGSGVVWGGKAAGSGVVWGGKAAGSGVVWGGKAAGSGVVWGGKAAGSGVVWGGKAAGSGVVWGGKAAGSGVVWGGKAAGSGVVWGGKAAGSGVVWGGKAAGSGVVWGGKAAGNTFVTEGQIE